MPAVDCHECLDHLFDQAEKTSKRISLRSAVGAWQDRRQWRDGLSSLDWRDLVDGRLEETVLLPTRTRDGRLEFLREKAIAIDALKIGCKAKIDLFKEQTGHGKSTFYERLREAGLN
ncbi:MAG: hypothetical protein BGO49_10355 [Planctomycetales bacterium 71-10]|nr:MAG: hypothetical protein BGO49_10355 [Planctomycetales bacterium 71-10]